MGYNKKALNTKLSSAIASNLYEHYILIFFICKHVNIFLNQIVEINYQLFYSEAVFQIPRECCFL